MTSYIYFAQAGNGDIKIGTTKSDPSFRILNLQTGCPTPIKLLGAIEGTPSQEKQIHLVLSHWRTQGEWFSPHPIVFASIKEALRVGKSIPVPAREPGQPKYDHPLCEFRAERNLTLEDMSKLTGLSEATLSRFESGAKKPKEKTLQHLVEVTGISAAVLRPDLVIFSRAVSQ